MYHACDADLVANVSIRDLCNNGGAVVDRAARGERITITKSGHPVAELHGLERPGLTPDALLERWRTAPRIDVDQVRADIDSVIDPSL